MAYLGEKVLDITKTEFKDYTPSDWAMVWIEKYGQIEGEHHKTWVLDQVARILKGTPVIVKRAMWDDGNSEIRVRLSASSFEYDQWVIEMLGEYDADNDEYEYSYDEGIAP